jgi:2-polyprenyl-6-methoxyphenol hydroxylase-like FAD-dependent oxidoreductase
MFRHPDPEVLVVGAGPVGLVATLFLQQQGVRVESSTRTSGRPSTATPSRSIRARSRILDEAGLSPG